MVVVTYEHLTPQRKLNRKTLSFRVEEYDDTQFILGKWVPLARLEVHPWDQIARKMSLRAEDYEWHTGTNDPLQFPWYDCEAITFRDPPRASTDIRPADSNDPEPDDPPFDDEGPSFGPGAGQSSNPQAPQSSGTTSGSDIATGGTGGSTYAPGYKVHTVKVKSGESIDVTFKCMGRTVGLNVKNDISEAAMQRLVANTLKLNLNGYWVATVTEGYGRIGALWKNSTVTLTPATPAQIQNLTQPRTSAKSDREPRKPKDLDGRKMETGTASKNWLAIQSDREHEVPWLEFKQRVERDKMVHVVTDGGARPNPGAAGWGVLMRQSGHYAINWGQWDMATNNAMEILAVTEALANLPDGMHVWIMTDSAYVKNGITQWVPTWIRNGWKNSGGARVANKSLWERLIAAVSRMKRVEWSWVKAHNGRLLNECADMLATRGVLGVPRPCPVATVRVVGEDTDSTVYELQDGEETPVCGKEGDGYPAGKTHVLKANAADIPFKGQQAGTQAEADALVQGIEECLREVRDLSNTMDETKLTDSEDESAFPMPEEQPTSSSPQYGNETPEEMSMRIYRQLKFWTAQNEWETRPRPNWWSQAWEELAEVKRPDGVRIPTGSPKEFRESITGDVFATDSFSYQAMAVDQNQETSPSVSPELTNVVAMGVWNESGTTMIRRCGRDVDINDLSLTVFKDALSITPNECELTFATNSDWLLNQWADMLGWQSVGYEGLDRKACPHQWREIMEHVETRLSKATLISTRDSPVREDLWNAVKKYGAEGIEWYKGFLETPDGAEYPPVAPLV
jgi:ribonuclease HI